MIGYLFIFSRGQRGKTMKNKKNKKKIVIVTMALILTGCSGGTSAKEYYKQGVAALENGQSEMAEEALYHAIEKKQEKAEYYIAYGMSLIKNGKYEEAQTQFDKAILDKNNKIVRENNKQAYRGKGIAYLESGQYAEAVESFETAFGINGKNELDIDILFYLAEANEKNGDYETAILVYNKMEKLEKSSTLYVKRAEANMELAQYDAAGNDFDRAIELDKSKLVYYLEKYFMLMRADREEEAKQWIATAKTEAKDEENQVYAAMIQYYQGTEEKALAALEELKKNNNILAGYYLGNIYLEKNEFEKAAECYELYINSTEKKAEFLGDVYGKLAQCYVNLSKYENAVILLEKAVATEKGKMQKELQKNLVAAYEKNLQFDKALQTAKSYLETYPKDKKMKREYKFLKSRVDTVKDLENSTDDEQQENVENIENKETLVPESTILPEETTRAGETALPSDNSNSRKPDIVQ